MNTKLDNKNFIEPDIKTEKNIIKDQNLLWSSLNLTNHLYAVNTLVRTIGLYIYTIAWERLTDIWAFDTSYSYWNILQTCKSLAHLTGVCYSYFKIVKDKDTNWITRWWLRDSVISYLGLTLIIWANTKSLLSKKVLIFFLFLNQIHYYASKGIRDGGRSQFYSSLSKHLFFGDSKLISDFQKQVSGNRKLITSFADIIGTFLIDWSQNNFSLNPLLLGIIGSSTNLIAFIIYYFKIDFKMSDPSMDDVENQRFNKDVFDLFSDSPTKLVKNAPLIFKNSSSDPSFKLATFISVFSSIKLSGLDKNFIILKVASSAHFNKNDLLRAKSISSSFNLMWDVLKVWYKKSFGKHIIGSLSAIRISSILMMSSSILLFYSDLVDKPQIALFLVYPIVTWCSNNTISSLMHLFEIWGLDDQKESSAFKSFRLNIISLSLDFLAKPWFYLVHYFNLFHIQQVIMMFFSILQLRKLNSITNEAEKI